MTRIIETTNEQRRAFGDALEAYMRRADMRSADIIRGLRDQGMTVHQASMTNWLQGAYEPPRAVVMGMERLLDLVPGLLSRYLGWLPVTAVSVTVGDVESAILADERLAPDQRQALIATYRALCGI